jgi:hypothetical protein
MQLTACDIPMTEFRDMLKLLERREEVMRKLGVLGRLPIFDRGDRVGFFFGPGDEDYGFGTLEDTSQNTAQVVNDTGARYRVSPFSLFAVK